ncbi:hypothetical protein R6Q59_025655 [Mikania micrantha]
MEQELHDGMFWLPPEFHDEFVAGKPNLNSDLSSLGESVTETESDEEDYLNELSRKLVQSTIQDGFWKTECNFKFEDHHSKVLVGSPESTLCGCNQFSSRGSSNCPSPAPETARQEPSWDVLYAAAGEVARMRLAGEDSFKFISPQPPRKIPSPNPQIPAAQLIKQQMMKQQMLKQQMLQHHHHHHHHQYQQFVHQKMVRNDGGKMKPVAPPASIWPPLQQSQQQLLQSGSGMRAVFFGNPNTKRESTGTGVFLPRQIGAPTETRKKRGCSTVLLPDRVMHALNLNLEAQIRSNGGLSYDAQTRYRNGVLTAETRRQPVEMDLRLPQEWTY